MAYKPIGRAVWSSDPLVWQSVFVRLSLDVHLSARHLWLDLTTILFDGGLQMPLTSWLLPPIYVECGER